MKILYIDRAKSFSEIRIGEKQIFGKHIKELGNDVYFLLSGNLQSKSPNVFSRFLNINNNSFLGRFIRFEFIDILLKAYLLHRKIGFDLIVSRKNITTGYAAFFLSRIIKVPYVYLLSFPTWEMIKEKGAYKTTRHLYLIASNVYLRLTLVLIRKADLVIPKTKYLWHTLSEKHKINNINHLPLPMGFEPTKTTYPNNRGVYNETLSLETVIVTYFGAMEPERNLFFIIDVIEKALLSNKNFVCVFIGGETKDLNRLIQYAKAKHISGYFRFFPQMNRRELFKYVSASDITISPIPPIPVYTVSSPTKVVESLGLSVPVLANEEIYEQKEVIEESGGGLVVPYTVEAFSDALISLCTDKERLKKLGECGKSFIIDNRTYRSMAIKLNHKLQEVVKNKSSRKKLVPKSFVVKV